MVEHDLAKVGVAGSNPVSRSFFLTFFKVALVAELVDALDLKSRGHFMTVPVRVRPGAPKSKGESQQVLLFLFLNFA